MLKKLLVGLVFSSAFSTLIFAQIQPKVQIGEALSGKEAKEMLQNFPKEVKSAIKVPQNKQTKVAKNARGGTYPYNNDVIPPFNSSTDSLVALRNSAGNVVLYVTYTTDKPFAEVGNILTIDSSRLDSPKDYAVQKWNPDKQELYSEYVNARTYYNGGRNPTDKYPEWGMPYSNSFGMWIKLGGYFSEAISLFNRNEIYKQSDPAWEYQYFNFQLLPSGLLSVTTKYSDYSTERIITTKPIPLNKWVYIQAIEKVLDYQIGWKAEDGSDEELVQKTFGNQTIKFSKDASYQRYFSVTDLMRYLENDETRFYINAKELFYNPVVGMFELMDNYNAKEKLIFSTGGQITYDINTLIQESYTVLSGGTSSILNLNDIDVYYDPQTLNILLIDWRINRQGAGK
ncbi:MULTISPECIES: hypothetical protein [Helicobacter]|uniref:Uncharacterized protein n=1 Tax=Helicobacter ganmani TaxID=60246 RepID=A0A3D8IEI5_9HELI|nr:MULTISPECIES: hypothetical protein [Helicobacter]RDU63296.1 hypothetical protein CQA43_03980 [Helicobacter ganmani]